MTIYYTQHVGATITGFFLMAFALATFAASILAGHQSDKIGRRPIMRAGTGLVLLGSILALVSNLAQPVNAWLTFGGFLLISFGSNSMMTAANAMIVDKTGDDNRKFVFTLDYWAGNLAIALGAALGAWLFKSAFLVVLGILVAVCVISFLIAWLAMKETFIPSKNIPQKINLIGTYKEVLKDKTYMIFLIANIFVIVLILQFDNFLAVHLSNSFQTTKIFGLEIYGRRLFRLLV